MRPSSPPTARLARHDAIAAALARLSDDALAAQIAAAAPGHTGVGGRSVRLEIEGTALFAKMIPLSDRERRPENVRSTANLFDLPLYCQYGLGGCPGFGAWRELEGALAATRWVRSGACASFPLLHHWRVLPTAAPAPPTASQLAAIEHDVAFWTAGALETAPVLRARLTGAHEASAHLVLVTEHFAQDLLTWLPVQLRDGPAAADTALALVDRDLASIFACLAAHGVVHFDPHFENLMTDGERLYLADFGLVLAADFALDPAAEAFRARHAPAYDLGRAAVGYMHCVTSALTEGGPWKDLRGIRWSG